MHPPVPQIRLDFFVNGISSSKAVAVSCHFKNWQRSGLKKVSFWFVNTFRAFNMTRHFFNIVLTCAFKALEKGRNFLTKFGSSMNITVSSTQKSRFSALSWSDDQILWCMKVDRLEEWFQALFVFSIEFQLRNMFFIKLDNIVRKVNNKYQTPKKRNVW